MAGTTVGVLVASLIDVPAMRPLLPELLPELSPTEDTARLLASVVTDRLLASIDRLLASVEVVVVVVTVEIFAAGA